MRAVPTQQRWPTGKQQTSTSSHSGAPPGRMSDQLQTLYTIIETLPQGLKDHLYRTQQVGSALSLRFGVDPYKVMLGALGHDIYRAVSEQQLLEAVTMSGIAVEPIEIRIPILLHGPLAAFRLQRDCGIDDKEILEAVRWRVRHSNTSRMKSTGCSVPATSSIQRQSNAGIFFCPGLSPILRNSARSFGS